MSRSPERNKISLETFGGEVVRLVSACEANSAQKAIVLLSGAIALLDAEALKAVSRLATLEETQGLLRLAFTRLRSRFSAASIARGGGMQS